MLRVSKVGPRDQRPAAKLFKEWLGYTQHDGPPGSLPVLPLQLFQPNDPKQLDRLYDLVKKVPQATKPCLATIGNF